MSSSTRPSSLTLLTPTCDQPIGLAFVEADIRRQTIWGTRPIQWIVVDDGIVPADLTLSQTHLRRTREPDCQPAQSFCRNLLHGLPYVQGDILAVIEHDDFLEPGHLAMLLEQLDGGALIAGDDKQRYYNVGLRRWRLMDNVGSSLCQTGMKRSVIPLFESALRGCLDRNKYGVDRALWESVPREQWALKHTAQVVGIKGLPGRPGLGMGHRPHGSGWQDDPDLAQLRRWIGAEADRYAPLQA